MADTHPHIVAMLQKYDLLKDDTYEALREILQEIVLYALSDAGFFNHAVFYEGTALRILYGLPRFSEDLDFSLLKPDPSFDLSKYEKALLDTLYNYRFEAQIETKTKDQSVIQSAFIKENTIKHLLAINAPEDIVKNFNAGKLLKIKFEVDTAPPVNFEEEQKLHLTPAPFMVKSMKPSSLFAGKLHAVLCRGWENRPKGRDWYDMIWYIQNGYEVNLKHLAKRLIQSCSAMKKTEITLPRSIKLYTPDFIITLLQKRVDTLNVESAKQDIRRFIYDEKELDIWSQDFFSATITMIKFKMEYT